MCGGVNRDIGFWFKVTFSVSEPQNLVFNIPTDFGYGGMSIFDGVVMKKYTSDMWSGGRATQLNFEAVNVQRGEHVMELFGGEGCCDGTTKW